MSTPRDFTYKGRGTNSQGNRWDSRDYGPEAPNQNPYHYSNKDGDYYYSNPDGSRYYNDGRGRATYTAPDGRTFDDPGDGYWRYRDSGIARDAGYSGRAESPEHGYRPDSPAASSAGPERFAPELDDGEPDDRDHYPCSSSRSSASPHRVTESDDSYTGGLEYPSAPFEGTSGYFEVKEGPTSSTDEDRDNGIGGTSSYADDQGYGGGGGYADDQGYGGGEGCGGDDNGGAYDYDDRYNDDIGYDDCDDYCHEYNDDDY
ncbi:hypothetical protein F4808DRAFT_474168 [Astrocystis sublimbata]|nr:hypothetical protein F4808DRAFT_474168 [Astrocystis sublimbata]